MRSREEKRRNKENVGLRTYSLSRQALGRQSWKASKLENRANPAKVRRAARLIENSPGFEATAP